MILCTGTTSLIIEIIPVDMAVDLEELQLGPAAVLGV